MDGRYTKLIALTGVILVAALFTASPILQFVQAATLAGVTLPDRKLIDTSTGERKAAPIATSGDNVYVTWPSNKTGNEEVMFRASTDGGKTFGDKINLSNSTNAESQDAHIDASGDRVFVTWWERNATSNQPVLRISTDNGKTFGSIMKLAANGTIGSSSGGQ